MGQVMLPQPVRPVVGMLSHRVELFDMAVARLAERWGHPDLVGEVLDFDFTDYYDAEMGGPPKRRFCSFPVQMDPADLPSVKVWANDLEDQIARQQGGRVPRPVNLDPGYLNDSKLVLASTKDHAHRIYLDQGIYAEMTLSFHHGRWHPMPWTYPDYRSEPYRRFFDEVRDRFMRERQS